MRGFGAVLCFVPAYRVTPFRVSPVSCTAPCFRGAAPVPFPCRFFYLFFLKRLPKPHRDQGSAVSVFSARRSPSRLRFDASYAESAPRERGSKKKCLRRFVFRNVFCNVMTLHDVCRSLTLSCIHVGCGSFTLVPFHWS